MVGDDDDDGDASRNNSYFPSNGLRLFVVWVVPSGGAVGRGACLIFLLIQQGVHGRAKNHRLRLSLLLFAVTPDRDRDPLIFPPREPHVFSEKVALLDPATAII